MTDIHIAIAGPADLAQLAPLFADYRVFYGYPHDLPKAHAYLLARLQQRQAMAWLARDAAGTALGFVLVYPTFCSLAAAPAWMLNDLFVAESARGRHVAQRLMQTVRDTAKVYGVARIDLSTAHGNTKAQALYEQQGYQLDTTYRYYSLNLG